ncbi:MAG: riboflavin synthase [Proteobacteria bacterium]|nr:riboflavin synthase [Pseudomonadota bacterium]
MFTGLIEELGIVKSISARSSGRLFEIECQKVLNNTKIGDSIAVNGICLTVTEIKERSYKVDVSKETLDISTAKHFKVGDRVNLERALSFSDRLGGHIVTGHIDTVGKIVETRKEGDFYIFKISYDKSFDKYVIYKGSIAINGISLTINEKFTGMIRLNIIPHTFNVTNLRYLKRGDLVNIEFDIVGKYIENFIKESKDSLSEGFLISRGFSGGGIL